MTQPINKEEFNLILFLISIYKYKISSFLLSSD